MLAREQRLEDRADQRLDEEHLREPREGEVEAHQLEPVGEQGEHAEAHLGVGVVQDRRDEAHHRAHDADGRGDDRGLKQHRMGGLRVKVAARHLEGERRTDEQFQRIGEAELDQDQRPDRHAGAEHLHAAQRVDRGEDMLDGGIDVLRVGHEGAAVDDIQAVEHVRVHGDEDGQEGEQRLLGFALGHGNTLLLDC